MGYKLIPQVSFFSPVARCFLQGAGLQSSLTFMWEAKGTRRKLGLQGGTAVDSIGSYVDLSVHPVEGGGSLETFFSQAGWKYRKRKDFSCAFREM